MVSMLLVIMLSSMMWITLVRSQDPLSHRSSAVCPYTHRYIDNDNFAYNCPGGDRNTTDYILFGFLGSFIPAYNGVGMIIAGAIPMAVEKVNK